MAFDQLRIIRLEASNVKRLRAVEITPKGDLVTVAGKNGNGKTSVLDSILWALGGGRVIQWKPIRDGEAKAKIVLDLGNADGLQLIVTRTFTAKDDGEFTTGLTIKTPDGMSPKGEQSFLNQLIGSLSFDPSEFIRAKPDEQVRLLKGIVAIADPEADFDAVAKRRQKAFESRADVNRDVQRLKGVVASLAEDPDAPAEAVSMNDLITKLDRCRQAKLDVATHLREVEAKRTAADVMDQEAQDADDEAERLSVLISGYRREAEEKRADAIAAREAATALEAKPPALDGDELEIRDRMGDVDKLNARHLAAQQRQQAVEDLEAAVARASKLTAAIDEADIEVIEMIARADLPVSGLAMTPETVTLRGVPFNQASDAEQLRAALALAMAANPKLRVIRIRDGSLLDEDAIAVIREVAGSEGFQIWMESVYGGDQPDAIILENGMVKEAGHGV